ncbi:MAG: cytochrome c oxidase accessory protein CcoG [Wenzhouxiangellaceae bacterium]
MNHGESNSGEQTIPLYVKAPKVYPREVSGRFSRLRVLAAWVLLGLFYVLPWVQLRGQQIVLFDLPARKFHVFGLTFWPQDFVMLAVLLAIAAVTLFFFTALAGRLWCGYACPQTVWTEVFLAMERMVEGPRNKRIKLDQAPWSAEKIRKKLAKQLLYISFSLWTGITFVGFFTPIRELVPALYSFQAGGWEVFWTLFYGFATYGNAGYLREQVCKYMCPYARFQSAMFDADTLIISYDAKRGEPRGKRRRDADPKALGLGDCIDCLGCVQVCPTGIDIRDGLQLECIACAACIDVCDQVMDKMGYPRGLIRYTTENAMQGRPTRIVRPRVVIYALVLAALLSLFATLLVGRPTVEVDVLRDRVTLYRLAGEFIENPYQLKLTNRTEQPRELRIEVSGLDGLEVARPMEPIELAPMQVVNRPLTLIAPRKDVAPGMHRVELLVRDAASGELLERHETRFFVPAAGAGN